MIFNAISAASGGGGGAKIATGSYVGTGTYGSSNPCSLTFDFEPKLLFISNLGTVCPQNIFVQYGVQIAVGCVTDIRRYDIYLTWDGTTVSWYSEDHAIYQLNGKDFKYKWFAIG